MIISTPYADLIARQSSSELEALRADIECQGILHDCLVTEDGRLLDGHARRSILPDAPVKAVPGSGSWSDAECHAYIFRLNSGRRNLSHDQRKEMLAAMRQTAIDLRKQDAKRFTQEKLAEMLGVSRQTISSWTGNESIASAGNAFIPCEPIVTDARVTIPKSERTKIVDRKKRGETNAQIAADYKVSEQRISQIAQAVAQKRPKRGKGKQKSDAESVVADQEDSRPGRYFCVHVKRGEDGGLNFSDFLKLESEAKSEAEKLTVRGGKASIAFVVSADEGAANYRLIEAYPKSAKYVIDQYLALSSMPILSLSL